MPHLTVEYSSNLDSRADVGQLCQRLLKVVLETGLFEIGAVRVRALRCEHYAIADRVPENAFVDLNFRIGAGRTQRQTLCGAPAPKSWFEHEGLFAGAEPRDADIKAQPIIAP